MSLPDWNDVLVEAGRSALDAALRACSEVEAPEPWYRPIGGVTAAELVARVPEGVEWLVPALVPLRSLVVLGAAPKSGKSLLTLDLAVAVAEGGAFLGHGLERGVALVCNFEDGREELSKRLQRRAADVEGLGDRLILLDTPPEPAKLLAELLPAVQRGRPDLVVVDPLVELLDGRDESCCAQHDSSHVTRVVMCSGPGTVRSQAGPACSWVT